MGRFPGPLVWVLELIYDSRAHPKEWALHWRDELTGQK